MTHATNRVVASLVTLCLTALFSARGIAAQTMSAPAVPNAQSQAGSTLADWNVTYHLPSGWQVGQTNGRLQMIVSNTDAGMIFLAPGLYTTPQESIADLSAGYSQLQMQAYPIEQPAMGTIAGFRSITAMYVSMDQMGRQLQGRFIGLLTPHGTGVNILGMTTPDKMPALRATVEQIAASVKAGPPSVNRQAIAAVAGQWLLYEGGSRLLSEASHSHEEHLILDGRGYFQWSSSTSVSVSATLGSAGRATSDGDQGTYTVIGNTMVFEGTKGQVAADFQMGNGQLVIGGKRYLRQ